jgi:hypothetical protein
MKEIVKDSNTHVLPKVVGLSIPSIVTRIMKHDFENGDKKGTIRIETKASSCQIY